MTVKELRMALNLQCLSESEPDRVVTGGYGGDLLSWVMGRAQSGDCWFTIMSNINVLAVATLADVACVVLAEGVTLEEKELQNAVAKGINVLTSQKNTYTLCAEAGGV